MKAKQRKEKKSKAKQRKEKKRKNPTAFNPLGNFQYTVLLRASYITIIYTKHNNNNTYVYV